MTGRCLGTLFILTANLALSVPAIAQAPQEPTPVYTGNLGGGFALTGGNTDTSNFNLTAGITRDPKTKHVTKGTASYLRGDQNSLLNLDRTAVNIRHEYTISGRTFAFGQLEYLRDRFKEITFLWVPAGGIGYKLVNTDATKFIVDGGVGGIIEKNPGNTTSKSGGIIAGQRFEHKLSATSTISQSLSSVWKTKDFADSLTNFSIGVTTTLVSNIQVKVEFIDSYKNKPANPALKKNDTAFVTAFIVKF